MEHKSRLTKLDGLRGIASIMVVLYHYSGSFLPEELHSLFFIRKSYTFVDFFFVLSGFVIAYNYNALGSTKELWVYVKKRFIRLYPMLFFSVLVYFLFRMFAIYFFPLGVDADTSVQSIGLKALDSLLLTNSTPILGTTTGLNLPSWSISSEMISYVIFGSIAIISNRKQKRILFLGLILISGITLFTLGTLFKLGDYGFIRGLFSFLLGYFVWELSLVKFKPKQHLEYLIPLLTVSCLYGLHLTQGTDKGLFFEFLVPLVFGLIILITLKSDGFISKQLNSRPIQFLGKISYSLYLNHFLVILIVPQLLFRFLKLANSDLNQMLVFCATLTISIIYSSITYKQIELRCSRILKKWLLH